PQDRVRLSEAKRTFLSVLPTLVKAGQAPAPAIWRWESEGGNGSVATEPARPGVKCMVGGQEVTLRDGSVVIAAITSCTNTSNPSVMVAAGLLAKKAAERGLETQPWVKTSLAPGSRVVTEYYDQAGLTPFLEALGFDLVGYGCTTCIGNSGPLLPEVSAAVQRDGLVVASVLSGNRNFEGRIHSEVRANYLMSPPLVVAFAIAGRIDIDMETEPLGHDPSGQPVFLRDIWPTQDEIRQTINSAIKSEMYRKNYAHIFDGDEQWKSLQAPSGHLYEWDPE